jgi:hypothetical protein
MKLIISRYFLYSVIVLEVLVLPKILPENIYTEIEYYKFLLYFTPFLLFGASSGYVYYKYNQNSDYFTSLLVFGFIHTVLLAIGVYIFTSNLFLSVGMFIIVLFILIEQRAKTEKEFMLAMSIKPIISLCLLFISFLYFYDYLQTPTVNILYYAMLMAFILWFSLVYFRIRKKFIIDYSIEIKQYFKLISKGFFISVGTLILMAIFFTDRYFTKEYYPDYLLTYSFSYNIVQFIILALTTIAYTNTISIGENIEKNSYLLLKQKLIQAYKLFLFLYIFFVAFVLLLSLYYDFSGFIVISLIMGLLIGNFYTVNSIGSIAQYNDFQTEMTKVIFVLFLVNYFLSYAFVKLEVDYVYLILKTGFFLNVYSFYFIKTLQGKE